MDIGSESSHLVLWITPSSAGMFLVSEQIYIAQFCIPKNFVVRKGLDIFLYHLHMLPAMLFYVVQLPTSTYNCVLNMNHEFG